MAKEEEGEREMRTTGMKAVKWPDTEIWYHGMRQRQNMILTKHYEVPSLSCVCNTPEKHVADLFPVPIIISCKDNKHHLKANKVCLLPLRTQVCDTLRRSCLLSLHWQPAQQRSLLPHTGDRDQWGNCDFWSAFRSINCNAALTSIGKTTSIGCPKENWHYSILNRLFTAKGSSQTRTNLSMKTWDSLQI